MCAEQSRQRRRREKHYTTLHTKHENWIWNWKTFRLDGRKMTKNYLILLNNMH